MRAARAALAVLLLAAMLCAAAPSLAAQEVPYVTVTPGARGHTVIAPPTHVPVGLVAPPGGLDHPEDLCVDARGRVWVADTGAGRIVSWDPATGAWGVLGAGALAGPTGVHAAADGRVYAADFAAGKVLVFAADGTLLAAHGRPSSPLFGKATPFRPRKVAADALGTMSVVSEGSQSGIAQLNAAGEFLGFTGVNPVRLSFRAILERLLFTQAQKAQLAKNLPPSPDNVAVDAEGILYTATKGVSSEAIRKLNVAGANLLEGASFYFTDYADIAVDPIGDIFGVTEDGTIVEFDSTGEWLFGFGNTDPSGTRLGLVRGASGIGVDAAGTLYVPDRERGGIMVYEPTAFFAAVHRGLALYRDGRYAESRATWEEALGLADSFRLAHKAIGQAAFKQQRYEEALAEFSFSAYRSGWSDAFWEIRNRWLQAHLGAILAGLAGLAVAVAVLRRLDRRFGLFAPARRAVAAAGRVKLLADLAFLARFLRHPVASYYALRREGRGSAAAATALYAGLVGVRLGSLVLTPFLFGGVDWARFSIANELGTLLVPLGMWVAANYLVAAIGGGEGRVRDVYAGSAYALAPYLLFAVPLALVSRALTLNEAFVVEFGGRILLAWSALNLFLMAKEVHNFGVGETVKNVLLTLFAMAILALAGVVLYVLVDQVRDFVYAIAQEVRIRAR